MKRLKKTIGGAANFWPGYVDAMTNVVLNLLFMVAMFGVTLAVFSQQNKAGKDGDTDMPVPAVSPPNATLGWPAPGSPPSPLQRSPNDVGKSAIRQIPPASVMSGPFGTSNTPDGNARSNTGIAPNGKNVLVSKGTNAAGAGHLLRSGMQAGPDATNIVVADAFVRKSVLPVTVTRRETSSGQVVLTLDAEIGADPVGAFGRFSVTAALKNALPTDSRKLKLWTSIPRSDPNKRRNAYLALTMLRNQLITAGVPASAMDVRVYEGAGTASGGLRLFVVTEP